MKWENYGQLNLLNEVDSNKRLAKSKVAKNIRYSCL